MKIKICVVVASRANYGRIKALLKEIVLHKEFELQMIGGASLLLQKYGCAVDEVEQDGFNLDRKLYYHIDGNEPVTQAQSTGLGIVELAGAFQELSPDYVITVADRYETMATAIAASYMNIPLIHMQGGEVSGNIDDRVRNAITQLADYHFVATENSRKRVVVMGVDPETVFNVGCPAMDVVRQQGQDLERGRLERYGGVGEPVNWDAPYLLVMQHSETGQFSHAFEQMLCVLDAVKEISGLQKVVLWPNADAGSEGVSKAIRVFRERNGDEGFHYYRNFGPEDYVTVLANCKCAIGNSSSFIREGEFLGVPAVIVGQRQRGREIGDNAHFVDFDKTNITKMAKEVIGKNFQSGISIYGDGFAAQKTCAEILRIAESLGDKSGL